MDALVTARAPSLVDVLSVHFPPGIRTTWDAHPVGQTRVGPDVWHWHGATGEHVTSHLSVAELPGDGS